MFQRTLEEEIAIKAPASKVWSIITDLSKYSEWNTFVTKIDLPNGSGLRVGAPVRLEIAMKQGAASQAYDDTITKVEPGKELVWAGGLGFGVLLGMKVEHFQILTEDGCEPGTCRYRQGEVFTGALVPAAAMTSAFSDLQAAYVRMNQELKCKAEEAT
jgi:hypothetical protein